MNRPRSITKSRQSIFFGVFKGFLTFWIFLRKKVVVSICSFSLFHFRFLYFCGSLIFPRTEILTKTIKISIEKLLHISQGFPFCDGQNTERRKVSSININKQCSKYKPGNNWNIHDKIHLWAYFRWIKFYALFFFNDDDDWTVQKKLQRTHLPMVFSYGKHLIVSTDFKFSINMISTFS